MRILLVLLISYFVVNAQLNLIYPNGGEKFVVGSDEIISWDGISESDQVKLEYSIDNGKKWVLLTDNASQLEFIWKNIPKPPSDECLIRVLQKKNNLGQIEIQQKKILYGYMTIMSLAYSLDGSKIISGSSFLTCNIWDADSGDELVTLEGHQDDIFSVSFSPDGNNILTGSLDETARIWDANTGEEIMILKHPDDVQSAVYSPDGTKIVTSCDDKEVKIWDAKSGNLIKRLIGHTDEVSSVAFSPNGKKIVSGSDDSTLIIWDANTGDKILRLFGHNGRVRTVAYSPDGKNIASGAFDSTIKIWDSDLGVEIHTLSGHKGWIHSISYSPDGKFIASGSRGERVRIWDTKIGNEILNFDEPDNEVHYAHSVAWRPDGIGLVTAGSIYRQVKVWEIGFPHLLQDTINKVFSIVMPEVISNDVDMLKKEVGKSKDSLITDFVKNIGSWKFNVDSIYFKGADSDAFSLLSGYPVYTVEANSSQFTEIRFSPKRAGIHNAEIVIITQADTLYNNITGEGIEPNLTLETKQLEFGQIYNNTQKDILVEATIKNIGNATATITNVNKTGADADQFDIISGDESFELAPNTGHPMEIRFAPTTIGSKNAIVEFTTESNDKILMLIRGESIENNNPFSQITIQKFTQQAGEEFEFILEMTDSEYMDLPNAPREFEAEISYNGTILYFPDADCDNNYDCTLNINGTWDGISNEILKIPAVATLGNTDFSDINIENFEWIDSPLDTDIELVHGSLTIDGICEEGGVRLFHLGDVAFSMVSRPQPFSNEITVQIGLREELQLSLNLMDVNGNEIQKLIDKETYDQGKYDFNFDTSDLNSGVYYLRLTSNKGELLNKVIKE
ncbi:choice-of-anchor D domain-containing protein [Candidatus Kapabacteria bacterium]|nr:choice-of-anchor D domain-containing protein [Candidatus Kapabacteria bacterium]